MFDDQVHKIAIGEFLVVLANIKVSDKNTLKLKNIIGETIFFKAFGHYFVSAWILTCLPAEIINKNTKLIKAIVT